MKILLTGATGFIGSHLTNSLIAANFSVFAIVRKHNDNLNKFCEQFIGTSYQSIYEVMSKIKPDVVIHLAALYINNHKSEDIPALIDSNILFGTNILESMNKVGVTKFVNIGTRWQHYNNEQANPANLYAATKEAFQDIVLFYAKKNIKYKTLELCDTFGTGDPRKKIVQLMFEACKLKKQLDLSPGEQVLDIVSVDDICNYFIKNISNEEFYSNERVCLSGTELQLKELGRLVEKITNTTGYLNFGGQPYRENEVMSPPKYGKIERISREDLFVQLEKYNN